jgi:PAS domain S-box-containing protein
MKRRPPKLVAPRMGAVLDAAPDAMVVVGPDGSILAANRHSLTLFGYTMSELIGQPIGCDGYIAKPLDTRSLSEVIAGFLAAAEEGQG